MTTVKKLGLSNLRTIVYIMVTGVAIFAVWYTGERSSAKLRHAERVNCEQAIVLTRSVNDLHGSLIKFLTTARNARLHADPHTRENRIAARDYEEILSHIHLVPPPVCTR